MAVEWSFTPPRVDAAAELYAAGHLAVEAAAGHILDVSRGLVPVDTGKLRDSGHVTVDGLTATISYQREGDDGYDVAVRQHEDMTLSHPGGGQAKYLEQPLHAEGGRVADILADALRRITR